jgi:hypothetical protein
MQSSVDELGGAYAAPAKTRRITKAAGQRRIGMFALTFGLYGPPINILTIILLL